MKLNVLITGATGGLGSAAVRQFLKHGCTVTALDVDKDALHRLEAEAGKDSRSPASLAALCADITDEKACADAAEAAASRSGPAGAIDVLVNNAGIITRSTTDETTLSEWNRVIGVNLTGTFLLTKAVVPYLEKSSSGRIINISSRASTRPHSNASPAYGAGKAALVYLTRHWAVEFFSRGILCFCISPGPIRTPMFEKLDPDYRHKIESEMIIKKAIDPEEIANIIWFAASECGPSMTGQTFSCNAGSSWG